MTSSAYADDIQTTGRISDCLRAVGVVRKKGPTFGIRFNAAKSKAVVDESALVSAREYSLNSAEPEIQVVLSARNLGGVIGCKQTKIEFQKANAIKWAEEVKKLARIAPDNPQAVYTAFTSSQKAKWQYQQRVCQGDYPEEVYGVIEVAIRTYMIPRLTGWNTTSPNERKMLALPVRHGGMAIDNPVESAADNYKTSLAATAVLQTLIIEGTNTQVEDIDTHTKQFAETTSSSKCERRERNNNVAATLAKKLPPDRARAFDRARQNKNGYFLLVRPLEQMGFRLSKNEWYDGVSTRYNSTLFCAPTFCDGHPSERYTLAHALMCAKGSNRIHRHDTVKNALQMIAQKAVGASVFHVEREPWLIRAGATGGQGRVCNEGLRGDLKIRGIHALKPHSVIDVRVTFPDGGENRGKETKKLIETQEEEKRKLYKPECDRQGHDFIPFVVTTDGVMGSWANSLIDSLARKLANKWGRRTGVVAAWIRTRLSIATIRATSACIRGSRAKPHPCDLEAGFEDGAALQSLLSGGA